MHVCSFFLQYSWLNQRQQLGGKGRARMSPLEMPLLLQYDQSLLQVMLREEEDLETTLINIHCGNMSQERMGQAPRGRDEAMCNGDATFVTLLSKTHISV